MEQMIKERYVNLEVAKLLRDKGFDEECVGYYINDEPDDVKYSLLGETNSTWESRCCSAPTQAMAVDWVRTKDVLITYDLAPVGTTLMVKVYKRTQDPDFPWTEGITIIRSTLEDAINDALKYALEKLL